MAARVAPQALVIEEREPPPDLPGTLDLPSEGVDAQTSVSSPKSVKTPQQKREVMTNFITRSKTAILGKRQESREPTQTPRSMTDGQVNSDLFGAKAMSKHRGFEPVCGQAWDDNEPVSHNKSGKSSGPGLLLRNRQEAQKPVPTVAKWANTVLQLKLVQGFMLLLTLGILYLGDLFQATADVSYDRVHVFLLWTCLIFFGVEYVLSVISSPAQTEAYVCSLFFFLDFLALLSIGIDIFVLEGNNLSDNGPIARAARAARIGTRAGRSARLLRLTRFLRLVRIIRFIRAMLEHRDSAREKRKRPWDEVVENDQSLTRADSIGAQIGATTTRKVVIMTLLLLIVLPLLERNESFHTCSGELVVMLESVFRSDEVQGNCTKFREEVEPWLESGLIDFSRSWDTGLTRNGLLYAQIERCVLYSNTYFMGEADPEQTRLASLRRGNEIQVIPCEATFTDDGEDDTDSRSATYLLYDILEEEIEGAKFAMGFTTVVVVTLLGFSVAFSQDAEALANQLVVPIGQLMRDITYTARLELDKVTQEEDIYESNVYEVRKLQVAYLNLNGAVGSFAKFTPLEVVRHFLKLGTEAKLGVAQRNVSIFFSDIVGFQQICEGAPPVEILGLLSEYFEAMVPIIVEEQGTMLEFIGDAILAIWNAPNSVQDHAVRAISAALRMNSVLKDLRETWVDQGKPDIRIRVGLHSADVFVGNLGSKMRMKYGVLGDGVNLASRVEELNKRYQTEVLISEDVFSQPAVVDAFHLRPVDCVVVKGRVKPTALYEVLAFKADASEQIVSIATHSDQAMRSYMARDFKKAIHHLEHILEQKGSSDPTGEVLLQRCRRYLEHPPPDDWDGSEVLKQKTFGSGG